MPPNFPMSNDSGFHETGMKKTLKIELKYVGSDLLGLLMSKNEHSPNLSLNLFSSKYYFFVFCTNNGPNNVECHMYRAVGMSENPGAPVVNRWA